MHFKQYFNIPKDETVEFLNIPIVEDYLAYIDPFLIATNRENPIFNDIYLQLKAFLTKLNRTYIVPNDRAHGLHFLSNLHEPNEYHLGHSNGNKGKSIGNTRAETIFDSLSNNILARAANLTITNEAHNVLLLVVGIGQDIMSDTIANVCRNVLAKFTYDQCIKHNIPTSKFRMHYYNSVTGTWQNIDFDLPSYQGKPIILLPRDIISSPRGYTNNYNYFVAGNFISKDVLSGKLKITQEGKFVRTLKNGTRKAIIKRILDTYRKPKSGLVDFVLEYNDSLDRFLDYTKEHYPALDLSDIRE